MERQLELDARIAAELNEKEHEAMNMLWECQCCFTETPFDNMTHCGEGAHFFCLECARMNAENEIGNGRHKLKCMDSSGCQAEFPRREVSVHAYYSGFIVANRLADYASSKTRKRFLFCLSWRQRKQYGSQISTILNNALSAIMLPYATLSTLIKSLGVTMKIV